MSVLSVVFSAKARKALLAGFVAFIGGVGTACADGNLDGKEVVVAVGVGLTALASVFKISNAK